MRYAGGEPFTACGPGSTFEATEAVREWLPMIIEKLRIGSIADVGAGDCAWSKLIKWKIPYFAFDNDPIDGVIQLDVVTDVPPRVDAVLCRHVLNHLNEEELYKAIKNIRASGSVYLIASQYDGVPYEANDDYRRYDLRIYVGTPSPHFVNDGESKLMIWEL